MAQTFISPMGLEAVHDHPARVTPGGSLFPTHIGSEQDLGVAEWARVAVSRSGSDVTL